MPKPRPFTLAIREHVRGIGLALLLVGVITALIEATLLFIRIEFVTALYLVPVLIASLRWGIVAAISAAIAGVGASAFFFYAPIYDFRVHNPDQIIDLVLFVIVAVVMSQLSATAREAKTREQAERLRDALIGSVSHELRTPLSSIIGSISVLQRSPAVTGNRELTSLVSVIQKEAERLNGDIDNLIYATRISSEGIHPHWSWIDPEDVVNTALIRKRGILTGRALDIEIADNLPLLYTDPTMIASALGQLVENAAKYSPPDAPISMAARQNGDTVEINVTDSGSGLSDEETQRIFERFYRAPRHAHIIPGSGLGLWIARSLVEACSGTVQASSPGQGRGATVSIVLPVRVQPASDEQPDD